MSKISFTTALAIIGFLATSLESAAATFDCAFDVTAESASNSFSEFSLTTPIWNGGARLLLATGTVDMKPLERGPSSRQDWIIDTSANGYLAIATIFEDGSFSLSEHSQDADGLPLIAHSRGHCKDTK